MTTYKKTNLLKYCEFKDVLRYLFDLFYEYNFHLVLKLLHKKQIRVIYIYSSNDLTDRSICDLEESPGLARLVLLGSRGSAMDRRGEDSIGRRCTWIYRERRVL